MPKISLDSSGGKLEDGSRCVKLSLQMRMSVAAEAQYEEPRHSFSVDCIGREDSALS
jgi:hypothetical protein